MSKRANGDGSVYRVNEGGGWVASMSFADPLTGKTRRRKRRAKTKAEAMQHLRSMQRELGDFGFLPDANRPVSAALSVRVR